MVQNGISEDIAKISSSYSTESERGIAVETGAEGTGYRLRKQNRVDSGEKDIREDTDSLIVPTICIYEVLKVVLRERNEDEAFQAIALMNQGDVMEL